MIGMTVCSGIGVAELAAPWIDWRYQSEIDPAACRVLAHRFPDAVNLGDMTKFKEWPDAVGLVDVLAGGTPCQDFSIAGARAGLDGGRGQLSLVFGEMAARFRPRWTVWENVDGVLSNNGGRDFAEILGMLCGRKVHVPRGGWRNSGIVPGIPEAYGLTWVVRDAQHVRTLRHPRAVPQRRKRVFVVGCLGGWRRAAQVLLIAESLRGNPPPRRQAGEIASGTLAARTRGGGGLGTDFDLSGGLVANSGDVGYCLTASAQQSLDAETETLIAQPFTPAVTSNPYGDHESREGLLVAHTLRGDGFDASEDGTGRGTPLVPVVAGTMKSCAQSGGFSNSADHAAADYMVPNAFGAQNSAAQGGGVSEGYSPTLDKSKVVGVCTPIAFTSKDHGADAMQDCSPTLRAGGHTASHANAEVPPAVVWPINTQIATRHEALGRGTGFGIGDPGDPAFTLQAGHHHAIATQWAVRRLMPVECERLMGLPDGFTDIPGAKPMADGSRYKLLGNAWALNAGESVFEGIRRVDRLPHPDQTSQALSDRAGTQAAQESDGL